ncbi:NAD(P)H-dependent oxidoreductase [Clostridium beijerinckii]|jgi:Nitroreductase|uniref:NAD(P)H-dependent oxidoreductase n=2 Tax=Clostridium beijerinckii TaxID=1520 RepID=A0A1S8PAD7_CLOBE|nr:NAD(P)H-dependent oxidoreductase [Clostridium beijerinckii]ABR32534.1 nitroreductase [Clostridium beijerinckii NCIMB 8052]AIU02904.1 nitroreductase [Clostridium beijerinckii ATCC 35702]AQS02979.1 putative NAD(P)H nitroreductase YfkO [Clostridium beijerinckii]MBA2888075.1 nitroreductase [Clostridium beijerinckii]MBA2902807.1 nitroreductase [Clostridium beijerinckii]
MNNKNKEIIDAFQFRHACKQFDPTKTVSEEDFNTILEAGRLSPSSFGFEPWKFLVVQNKSLKEKLFPVSWGAQNSFSGASHFVILLARKKVDTIYNSEYITKIMSEVQNLPEDVANQRKSAFESFEKNDFNLLESDRAIFDWASKQTYIALANMLTAAAFLQIDSCPIEGFNIEKVEEILKNEGILDTEHFGVSVMASFGYRAKEPHEKTRQPLNSIVQWI